MFKRRKELNVLSIDWDYFINANDVERYMLFPDGGNENIPEDMKSMIWAKCYAHTHLEKMGIVDNHLDTVINLIKSNIHKDTQYMIADSHKYCYDFVVTEAEKGGIIHLYNIDYHHDVFENDSPLDCGNWLNRLMRDSSAGSTFTWISRSDSDNISSSNTNLKQKTEDFSVLEDVKWDMVYICRSGTWSPPHLDDLFSSSFKWIADTFTTKIQKGIFESRYDREFNDLTEVYKKLLENDKLIISQIRKQQNTDSVE